MRHIVTALCALLVCATLFAQDKHPFTFEDLMKLKRVEEPVPSPDGKWVLFAAVDVDLAANTKTPHIWIVPLNQDKGSQVSQNQGDLGHPTTNELQARVPVIFQEVVHSIETGEADCASNHFRGESEWTSTRMPDLPSVVERS